MKKYRDVHANSYPVFSFLEGGILPGWETFRFCGFAFVQNNPNISEKQNKAAKMAQTPEHTHTHREMNNVTSKPSTPLFFLWRYQ